AETGCVFTGTSGLSLRRSALKRLGPIPEELRISADSFLYLSVLQAPVGNIGEVLAFRRVHGANLYAGRLLDPIRLERQLEALSALRSERDKRLAEAGLSLSPAVSARLGLDEAKDRLFLERGRGRWAGALEAWKETRGAGLFK